MYKIVSLKSGKTIKDMDDKWEALDYIDQMNMMEEDDDLAVYDYETGGEITRLDSGDEVKCMSCGVSVPYILIEDGLCPECQ